jgi:photosystem II stability/assembly factor-like uncharacterized protein
MHGESMEFRRPVNYQSIAVSPDNPQDLIAGTWGGDVLRSTDGGRHWTLLRTGDKAITKILWLDQDRGVYVASEDGLRHWDPRDDQWADLTGGPRNVTDFATTHTSALEIYAAGDSFLWISKDGGHTWKKSAPVPDGKTDRMLLFSLANKKRRILTATKDGWKGWLFESVDDGQSWNKADRRNYADEERNPTRIWAGMASRALTLASNPFNSKQIFKTTWWDARRSDDAGKIWHEKIQGAPNVVGSDLFISAEGNIYVATMDNGLLRSKDGGLTYEALFPSFPYNRRTHGHVWRVHVWGREDAHILATSSPWDDDVNQMIYSSDGGKNFKLIREGLPDQKPRVNTMWGRGYARALAKSSEDANTWYLGMDGEDGGGFFISRDGGQSWGRSKSQPSSRRIYNALSVDPSDPRLIYWGAYGEKGGVYVTEDEGESWRYIHSKIPKVFDIAVSDQGVVYAAGSDDGPALDMSKDKGKTWARIFKKESGGSIEALRIHPKNSDILVMSKVSWNGDYDGRIYLSADAGLSWKDITGDLPYGRGASAMDFHPTDGHLYITRYAGGVYKCFLNIEAHPA